ncbi:MAG: serine/threonine protein kinase [Acidobacteria bacterium]|nr:serine/threonine protein kinase [Acidobacteriota bacterium]
MTKNPDPNPSGRTFGRYELIREIGRGAMGRVYLARDPAIDRQVALKTVSFMEGFPEEERKVARQRFLGEARAAGGLLHPSIITIFDVGEHDGQPFIAMEYVEGTTLEKHSRPPDLLEVERVVALIAQAARALQHAHTRNIVHRDIKPPNLMLANDGTIKIADFGLAKNAAANLTQDGTILGTPYYMSPEQVMGRQLDGRSDLFSLAVVLYELLGGYRPFEAEDIRTILYRIAHEPVPRLEENGRPIPRALHEVLTRALAKKREERFANGEILACALEKALHNRGRRGEATVVLTDAPAEPRARRSARRRPAKRANAPQAGASSAVSPLRMRWMAAAFTGGLLGFFPTIVNRHFEARPSVTLERPVPVPVEVPENARLRLNGVLLAGQLLPAGILDEGRHRLEVETPCERGELTLEASVDPPVLLLEPRTQRLPLMSDPPGAEVWLDGETTGLRTPAGLDLGICGTHRVELKLKGYETVALDLEPQGDWLSLVEDTLALNTIPNGVVQVPRAPYEVQVLVEGIPVGGAGDTIELPPGRVALVLRNRDLFLNRTITVDIEPGGVHELAVQFGVPGMLSVHAQPSNCAVSIDGRNVGSPPILNLPVVAGKHLVRCRLKATGEEQVQSIQISSGRNAKCQFKF